MNNSDAPLIVYGHGLCLQARLLAVELKEYQIAYEWRDVLKGEPRFRAELMKLAHGSLSVPTVVLPDGTVMVEPWPTDVLDKLGVHRPSLIERLWKH